MFVRHVDTTGSVGDPVSISGPLTCWFVGVLGRVSSRGRTCVCVRCRTQPEGHRRCGRPLRRCQVDSPPSPSDTCHHSIHLYTHLYLLITLPVESAPFFIRSTSFCSLSSWFTSSCTHHLVTVTTFARTICYALDLPLQT